MTAAVSDVRLETSGAIAELVLDSAPVNALTTGFLASWNAALDGIGPPVRALVVRSALAKTFVAGGDLRLLAAGTPAELRTYVLAVQRAFGRLSALPVPVICAIDGHCLGGGLELALAADIVVATPRSSFGLPEARLGILPAAGGLHRLVRRTGEGTARRLMLTGQRIDGQRAAALGIVDDLTEPGGCLAHARALAGDLASLPPAAVTAIKALTNTASDRTMEEGLAEELASWLQIRDSAETRAALTAALEHSTGRGGP